MKTYKFVGILMMGLLLIGCTENETQPQPRTYYESLALDTPETAVETFVSAFQQDNFEALYLIFVPVTQKQITSSISLLQYQDFVKANDYKEANDIASDSIVSEFLSEWEHTTTGYRFDSLMLAAKEHSAFLIDLSGDVSILRTQRYVNEESFEYQDVVTKVEGIEGDVIFRMTQAPSGRWRVRQIIVPGGDEEQLPFSMPATE